MLFRSTGSQSTVNNNQSKQTVNFAPQMTVVQQPGESGENLSKRIVKTLNQQVATAARNNDTGIVRYNRGVADVNNLIKIGRASCRNNE